jgi:hypothetical protein
MRQISSWGLVVALFLAVAGDARASDSGPNATVGLGLTIGGAAITTVSGVVLWALATCRPDPDGEGCPPNVEKKAAAIGFVLGIVALAVGIPLYATANHDQREAAYRQAGAAIQF